MALGYAGHADWRDMSEYLAHLTVSETTLTTILRDSLVRAINPYGAVYKHPQLRETQKVACLSEIPVDRLARLASKRGRFGIVLDKRTTMKQGALPVWYLHVGTPAQRALFDHVRQVAYKSVPDLDSWLWELTPFIDYPGEYDRHGSVMSYEWSWEREWRVHGDLPFAGVEVQFLIAPESAHARLDGVWRSFGDNPAPPIFDAAWPIERIQHLAIAEDL